MADAGVICEGDHIIWDVCGDRQVLVEARGNCKVKLGSKWVPVRQLIGKPWGIAVQLASDNRTLDVKQQQQEWDQVDDTTTTKADRIYAGDDNQALSTEDIEELRNQGISGAEIVERLAQGSKNFENKTEFAQKKWLKRKAKKYCPYAIVRRPCASTICEAMFSVNGSKIWDMRVDSLAALMHYSNVMPFSRVLVLDDTRGLVSGAAAERMGGEGTLWSVALHAGKASSTEAMRAFNLSEKHVGTVRLTCLSLLIKECDAVRAAAEGEDSIAPSGAGNGEANGNADDALEPQIEADEQAATEAAAPHDGAEPDQPLDGAAAAASATTGSTPPSEMLGRRRVPLKGKAAELRAALQEGFDCLLVAMPSLDVQQLLTRLLMFVRPSACFAVYSQWLQPLAEAVQHMNSRKQALNVQLHEGWMRPYQVLPLRTHPTMIMAGTGGYLMTGVALGRLAPTLQELQRNPKRPRKSV